MIEHTPKICISGREVDFLQGGYKCDGGLTAATLTFKIALTFGGLKKLWNKEVTFFLNAHDSTPIFRGWIKRVKESYDDVEIFAEDALGYMLKSGESGEARVVLDDNDNLDGLVAGAAIKELLVKTKLDTKLKTDLIGDTNPPLKTGTQPFRGALIALDIVKELLTRSVNTDSELPRPNIGRIIDDGTYSQFIIELESELESTVPKFVFTERFNIAAIDIIKRKVPTVIIVTGDKDTKGTFVHDGALSALDRSYLEVNNKLKEGPAECKDFAALLFEANLKVQYEYSLKLLDGAYLMENDVVKVITDDPEFGGNFRVIGKAISFSPSSFSLGLTLNKKPPTLAEYISSSDN